MRRYEDLTLLFNCSLQSHRAITHSHCRHLLLSMSRLDRGLLSEPLSAVQVVAEHSRCLSDRDRLQW